MERDGETQINATWWDHHELTFWLWAFIKNSSAYLECSAKSLEAHQQIFERPQSQWRAASELANSMKRELSLAEYHFVSTMGVLIRVLRRSQHVFPQIQPIFSRATHLLKEGKELRDMIEHAYGKDGYLSGGGRNPEKFVRSASFYSADATSTMVIDGQHWLGGRLCVEMVTQEVLEIKSVADSIPAPDCD